MPLKAKATSSNWDQECFSLKNVLNSIFYQSETNITPFVYLSCHDVPYFIENYEFKKNIIIINNNNLVLPTTIQEKNNDKQNKKKQAIKTIARSSSEGDLIAIFDADDLCHSELFNNLEFQLKNTSYTDFVFHTGYMFNNDTKDFAYIDGINNIFYKICGSCIVSRILKEDIDNDLYFFYKLSNHTKFFEICESNNRLPHKYSFPAMLYMHNSVNNLSSGNIYIRKIFQDRKVFSNIHDINLIKYYYFTKEFQSDIDSINSITTIIKNKITM